MNMKELVEVIKKCYLNPPSKYRLEHPREVSEIRRSKPGHLIHLMTHDDPKDSDEGFLSD